MTSFNRFYQTWLDDLRNLVDELAKAPKQPTDDEQNQNLLQLVQDTMAHYTEYYRIKSLAARHDVFSVFANPWSTSLERSLHWIGGCRPTTVFHIVYTESSSLFNSRFNDIINGIHTGDLGDLSPGKLQQVSDLQCETVRQENSITKDLSELQEGAVGLLLPDLASHGNTKALVEILQKADDLRLTTLKREVELLTPLQAVEFLTATAEFHFVTRGLGVELDRDRHNWIA
ncbi:protein DOG1-like 1 [Cornus florida]|uniref:protein DOG1-like 1 n=1 Tax=Cornus florida TaxID=4283 RepID=UPI0028969C65|nr:protein DOG1-like 1 [Cornus florida]